MAEKFFVDCLRTLAYRWEMALYTRWS